MDWQETYPVLGAKLASNSNLRPLANYNREEENNNKSNTFMPEMHWIAQAESTEWYWQNVNTQIKLCCTISTQFNIDVLLGENWCWSLFELKGLRNRGVALVEEQNPNF